VIEELASEYCLLEFDVELLRHLCAAVAEKLADEIERFSLPPQ